MPFVLVGLGDLLWAVMLLLVCIAGYRITVAIINRLPNWGIPFTSINIHSLLDAVALHIQTDVVDTVKGSLGRIASWIRAHWYLFFGVAGGVVRALVHHAAQIAHLNNTTIPAAQNAATATAHNELATVQHNLQANIDSTARDATASVATLHAYVDGAFETKLDRAISDAASGAEVKAHAELAQVESTLAAQLSGVQGQVTALDNLVQYTVPAEIATAVADEAVRAHAELVSNVQAIASQMTALQAEIDQITAAIAANTARIATAQDNIARLQGAAVVDEAAITANRQDIATARGNIDTLTTQLDTANGAISQLGTKLDTVTSEEAITQSNVGALQQTTSVAIPAAIAAVAAGVVAITTEFERCGVTTCDGPNSLENALKGLLAKAAAVGEFGFIAQAIHDPTGTADALAPILGSISSGATDTLDALLAVL